MSVDGVAELKARLKAIRVNVAKPAGKEWADEAVLIARGRVGSMTMPYSKGALVASIRRKSATQKKAVVVAIYHSYFVDAGVVPHSMVNRKARPKSAAGKTIFARAARKPHPGYKARPFRGKTATEALRRKPIRDKVIKAWNEAA